MSAWQPDKRLGRRIYVKIPVTLCFESQNPRVPHRVFTRDFSLRGMRVRTNVPLWPSQIIEVTDVEGSHITVRCRVMWVHATGAGQKAEAGLQFLNPIVPHWV